MLVLILLTVSETIAKHMENLSKFNSWYANVLGGKRVYFSLYLGFWIMRIKIYSSNTK